MKSSPPAHVWPTNTYGRSAGCQDKVEFFSFRPSTSFKHTNFLNVSNRNNQQKFVNCRLNNNYFLIIFEINSNSLMLVDGWWINQFNLAWNLLEKDIYIQFQYLFRFPCRVFKNLSFFLSYFDIFLVLLRSMFYSSFFCLGKCSFKLKNLLHFLYNSEDPRWIFSRDFSLMRHNNEMEIVETTVRVDIRKYILKQNFPKTCFAIYFRISQICQIYI